MSERPPLRSISSHASSHDDDPFADRPRGVQFADSTSSIPRPYESTSNLNEFGVNQYGEEELEKQPLNVGQSFAGGFYPPG